MKPYDFRIGDEIRTYTNDVWYRIVDIGWHGVAIIALDKPDASWYEGPTYAVPVLYWDQDDIDSIDYLRRDGDVTELE